MRIEMEDIDIAAESISETLVSHAWDWDIGHDKRVKIIREIIVFATSGTYNPDIHRPSTEAYPKDGEE